MAQNGQYSGRSQTPAAEYPAWIVELVKARLSPMVPLGGTFVTSWRALHESGVEAGIARAYADAERLRAAKLGHGGSSRVLISRNDIDRLLAEAST